MHPQDVVGQATAELFLNVEGFNETGVSRNYNIVNKRNTTAQLEYICAGMAFASKQGHNAD